MPEMRWLLPAVALALVGCSGGSATLPTADQSPLSTSSVPLPQAAAGPRTESPSAGIGGLVDGAGVFEGATALYRISVDPSTLTATAGLAQSRSGQATDDQYELDISVYFKPSDLKIVGVTGTATTVDLTYQLAHPFPAPSNLSAPATAANRADLGISGRVLYMVDTPSIIGSTYFSGTDSVLVNTNLVTNADGYYKPNDLLDISGFLANTFPYRALVNETLDPRLDPNTGSAISNGGTVTGNYNATTGWQGTNIGPNRNGWTGYGVLHQGQAIRDTISLRRSQLGAGFSFDVALLAKFTDPRGGASGVAKRANRLPSSPANVTNFIYREPHGSLDVERISFLGEGGGFYTNAISASELRFHVVDWDARATGTSAADLADDPNPMTVPVGANGAPSLSVCIPGVLGDATAVVTFPGGALTDDDSAYGGDAAQDSGEPGDPLYFRHTVTKSITSGQVNGLYTGLVRVADPEINLASRITWYFPLNGAVVPPLPLTGSDALPEPVAYQAFQVVMTVPNDPPVATFSTPGTVISGLSTTHTVQVTSAFEPDNNPITVEIDWDGGANSFVVAGVINPPYAPLPTYTSPSGIWANSTASPQVRTINVRYSDGIVVTPIDAPNLSTTLGANRAPTIMPLTNVSLAASTIQSGQSFQMNAGTVVPGFNVTDPEGDLITFRVYDNLTPGSPKASGTSFPITGLGPYTNPGTSSVTFTTYATDPLHPTSATGTAFSPTRVGTVLTSSFAMTWGASGGVTTAIGVCLDGSGNAYIAGTFQGTVDFDPGAGTQNRTSAGTDDIYCLSLDPYGAFRWVATVGGTGQEFGLAIANLENGNVVVGGYFVSTSMDFDPGAGVQTLSRVGAGDGYLLHLTQAAGEFVRVDQFAGGGALVRISTISKQPGASRFAIGGSVSGNADFDPGAGVQMRTNFGSFDGFYVTLDMPATFLHGGLSGGTGTDLITGVAMASDGTIWMSGYFQGSADLNPTSGTTSLTSNGGFDAFYCGVSLAGAYVGNRRWGGATNEYANAIALNATTVFVTGGYTGTVNFNPYGTAVTSTSAGDQDAYLTSWPLTLGVLNYGRFWGSTLLDQGRAIALTSAGAVRISGNFTGTVDFDPGGGVVNRSSAGASDAYILALSAAGLYESVATYGGTSDEDAVFIAINALNEPRIAGTFNSPSVDFDPGAGTQTRTQVGTRDAYLLGLQSNLTW
ncbi:MAG: hypothetical protein GEEBNDBF_02101 [bacterium]|nr:hypothetical protein [bacterium]